MIFGSDMLVCSLGIGGLDDLRALMDGSGDSLRPPALLPAGDRFLARLMLRSLTLSPILDLPPPMVDSAGDIGKFPDGDEGDRVADPGPLTALLPRPSRSFTISS
jgi:hypothetical protein